MTGIKPIYDPVVFTNELESIDHDRYLLATVYFESTPEYTGFVDHLAFIYRAGTQGATGSWVAIEEETKEIIDRLCFKIVGFYQIPSEGNIKRAVVQFAYPTEAWPAVIPQIMLSPAGNLLNFPGKVRLLGVSFPKSLVEEFKGPKFGISGLRSMLKVEERPFYLAIAKPKMGMTPEETARQAYESYVGGADMYKDDEMLIETWNCKFEDRLTAVLEAKDRAQEETGEKKLYFIVITDRIEKLLEKAEKACQMGATGFLLPYSAGFEALRILSEDPSVKVPLMFHPAGSAIVREQIAWPAFSKFYRLCGADITIHPFRWGTAGAFVSYEEAIRSSQVLRAPFYHIKSTLPGPGGGMYPGLIPTLLREFGTDVVYMAGGGTHGHPGGTTAGAKAWRQGIDAAMNGIPLEEAAEEKPELKAAIELWGVFKRPIFPYDGMYVEYPPKIHEETY